MLLEKKWSSPSRNGPVSIIDIFYPGNTNRLSKPATGGCEAKSLDQKESHLGHFTVQGEEHAGLLVLDGKKSKLEIYADRFLHIPTQQMKRVVRQNSRFVGGIRSVGQRNRLALAVSNGMWSTTTNT